MLNTDEYLRKIASRVVEASSRLLRRYICVDDLSNIVGRGFGGDDSFKIDVLIEKHIVEYLEKHSLKLMIVTEEYGIYKTSSSVEYIALVDPLDGSLNYISKIPVVAVSIVFYRIDKPYLDSAVAGAVSNVFMNEIYSFNRSKVFISNYRIDSIQKKLNGVVSIYTETPDVIVKIRDFYINKLGIDAKTRTLGSSSIESIYAALNRIDLFLHNTGRLRNLDIAGGVAIANRLRTPCIDLKGNSIRYRVDDIENIESIVIGLNADKIVENIK